MPIGVILAAGKGSRLRQVSNEPKPLSLIAGHNLLSHVLSRFANTDVDLVYIVVRSHEEDYQQFIKRFGEHLGKRIEVVRLPSESYVDSPLTDLIHLAHITHLSPQETLLVSYSDVVTTFNLASMMSLHSRQRSEMTLLLFSGDRSIYKHEFRLSNSGAVTVVENTGGCDGLLSNAGIFILKYRLLESYDVRERVPFSFPDGPAVKACNMGALYGCTTAGHYFKEVGTPKNFIECSSEVRGDPELRIQLFPFGT